MASSLIFQQNRDVQRAGWLKYIPFAEKYSSTDEHKFWVVFAIYDQQIPYLEFYQKRQTDFGLLSLQSNDGPVSKHSLLKCKHIQSVIETNQSEMHNEFTITLESNVIRLAADTDEVMYDWINCLKQKLVSMNILQPSENLYSINPELPSRHPNIDTQNIASSLSPNDNPINTDELYEPIFELSQNIQQLALGNGQTDGFLPAEEGPPPYELISSPINQITNPSPPRPTFRETQVEKFKKEMEQINGITIKVRKRDCNNTIAFVDIHMFGIFIAGWKQKEHPHLHNTFHIGDQLVNINGTVLESAKHAKQFIKQCSHTLEITVRRVPFGQIFCLKRSYDGEDLGLIREKGTAEIVDLIPNGVASRSGIFSKCTFYNEYDDNGSSITSTSSQQNHNWFITEINNRPVNLFFKDNEISDRLNAIGKEISILIQPFGFIKRLKKQLKTFKNYKDFIVQ